MLHAADLSNKFNPAGQALDIVETAAIYAQFPKKFMSDVDGKKEKVRAALENNLKELMGKKHNKTISKSTLRHPFYAGVQPAYGSRRSLHDMETGVASSRSDCFTPAGTSDSE